MRVHDSLPLHEGTARELFFSELGEELVVDIGRRNLHVCLSGIISVKICEQVFGNVGSKLGKNLATKHVSAALDLDHLSLFVVMET